MSFLYPHEEKIIAIFFVVFVLNMVIFDAVSNNNSVSGKSVHPYILQGKEEPVIKAKGSAASKIIPSNNEIAPALAENPVHAGYIIEFYGEPAAKYSKKLIDSKHKLSFSELEGQDKLIVKQKIRVLKSELEKNLFEIKSKLNKQDFVVRQRFVNSFFGASFDISKEESEVLKSMSFVKAVYPNWIVKTSLMDSVPIINADDVWVLNVDGLYCSIDSDDPDNYPPSDFECEGLFPSADILGESWSTLTPGNKKGLTVVKNNGQISIYSLNNNCNPVLVKSVPDVGVSSSAPASNLTSNTGSNVCYSFGDVDFSGLVNITDILCVLRGFGNIENCPHGDISPCGGDGLIDISDVEAVLVAFGNEAESPYYCPDVCPICGNTVVEGPEMCDGFSLAGKTCSNLGLTSGVLSCVQAGEPNECTFNTSLCNGTCLTGGPARIGIIDTGVGYTHPDLGGCLGPACKVIGGYDFVNNDSNPMDDAGHGTHVASIAAGNGVVKGVAPDAKIVAYKVLNNFGAGPFDNIIAAIDRSVDPNEDGDFSDHLDVINLSLGLTCKFAGGYTDDCGPNDPASTAIDNASALGVIAVVSAGNSGVYGVETIGSPGTAREAITVGATCKPGEVGSAPFCLSGVVSNISSIGPTNLNVKPEVLAPGINICAARLYSGSSGSSCIDNYHVKLSGTSMAAPHVAGAVALLKQQNPSLNSKEVKDLLMQSSVNQNYRIISQGFGLIDVLHAVQTQANLGLEQPYAKISGPMGVVLHSQQNNVLQIIGSSMNGSYSLYYSNNVDVLENLQNWTLVCSGSQNISQDTLCELNVTNFSQGKYYLRLETTSPNGKKSFDQVVINLTNAKITSPIDVRILGTQQIIPTWLQSIAVTGIATANNFDHYVLSICNSGLVNCQVIHNSNQEVFDGQLGALSLSSLTADYYELKLDVYNSSDLIASDIVMVYVENQLKPGWPVNFEIATASSNFFDAAFEPVVVDLDLDGQKEIIYTYGYTMSIFSPNGELLNSFNISTSCSLGQAFFSHGAAIANLDSDNQKEIVIGDSCGYIHIFNSGGVYLNSNWPKLVDSAKQIGGITLSDIDNDSSIDVLFGTHGAKVFALNLNGQVKNGWPYALPSGSKVSNPLAVFDFENNGEKELVVNSIVGTGNLRVLNMSGVLLSGWPKSTGCNTDKAIADIDNDTVKEIIAFGGDGVLHVFNLNGTYKAGYPKTYPGFVGCSPDVHLAISDLENDNLQEIIFTNSTKVGVVDVNGNFKQGFPVFFGGNIYSALRGFPLVGQLDSDPQLEISVSIANYTNDFILPTFYAFNHDGSIVNGFPKSVDNTFLSNGAVIADLDNDGANELISGPSFGDKIYAWGFEGQNQSNEWTTFFSDLAHTSCYRCN